MLNEILIEGFKCIDKQTLELKPLTILTGRNSSGKSSVIQALLLLARYAIPANQFSLAPITEPYSDVRDVRNKFTNSESIEISLPIAGHNDIAALELRIGEKAQTTRFQGHCQLTDDLTKRIANGQYDITQPPATLLYEPADSSDEAELFYLSANRTGPADIAPVSNTKVGLAGEYLLSSFERLKREPLPEYLAHFNASNVFGFQVSQWLSVISDTQTELKTEKLGNDIKISLDSDGLKNVSPLNVGAGLSYVAKVIILCLMAKKGDLILLENPEIHLHPKAQAQLGVFFAFIAGCGIQLIVETHCEHLINKVRYQVYQDDLSADDVVIHYKKTLREPFEALSLNGNGQYINRQGKQIAFPGGFFDGTIKIPAASCLA